MEKTIPVRVAVRCRPLVHKEIVEGCQTCVSFTPCEPQIVIGKDRAFTYDYVFPPEFPQCNVYDQAVSNLIPQLFKGYNVTVLAYGQTGSGKTYTMGTSYSPLWKEDDSNMGIIPRAIDVIFAEIVSNKDKEYVVKVSFLEIYKEEILDLLSRTKEKESLPIREDCEKGIRVVNLTEVPVTTTADTLKLLEEGSLSRSTASTNMNSRSSRSHAIFTIIVEQRSKTDPNDVTMAKFHLVDLAGSERAKKTKAEGERFKEGVNINRGLLALGNVISALCDESYHVPYRDSKLTRLLQDSLGGNSHTIMIACISPADTNLDETVNTLRYADRARKIKNKPVVNRDPQTVEIMRLRQMIQEMQLQLLRGQTINGDAITDSLVKDIDLQSILERNKFLEEENKSLSKELQRTLDETTRLCEKLLMTEAARDKLKQRLQQLKEKTGRTIEALNKSDVNESHFQEQLNLVKELQETVLEYEAEQTKRDLEYCELESPEKKIKLECEDSPPDSPEDEKYKISLTMRQAAMSKELQQLERALALKEELASKMAETDCELLVVKSHYENNIKLLEEEITTLQKEKEALVMTLKNVQTNPANKVSEQRGKRLQDLEEQISKLKKKLQESSRMLKLKEESDKKSARLQQEILSIKQARVKLIKQMKEESEKYRQYRQAKDREVARLKDQDRKRQAAMAKMEQLHSKQQNVMKRKMEEAVAANRRLQHVLSLRSAAHDRRGKDQNLQETVSKLKNWLSEEVDVIVMSKDAEHHLQSLLDARKETSEQLSEIRTQLEKIVKSEDLEDETESVEEMEKRIKELEKDLKVQNTNISELQQKILDADHEDKDRTRWESFQNLIEARSALKYLFQMAWQSKMETNSKERSYQELNTAYSDLQKENASLKKTIEEMQLDYDEQFVALEREHQEKTLYMLKHTTSTTLNSSMDLPAEYKKRLEFQELELSRLGLLSEELERKTEEVSVLKKELSKAQYAKLSMLPDLSAKKKKQTTRRTAIPVSLRDFEEDILDDSFDVSYNEANDPDWVLDEKPKDRKRKSDEETEAKQKKTLKKSVSMTACKCASGCKGRCGCYKKNLPCTQACGCKGQCQQDTSTEKSLETLQETNKENEETSDETAFFDDVRNLKQKMYSVQAKDRKRPLGKSSVLPPINH